MLGQSWHQLLFAHWQVAPEALAALLPPGLSLDTYDGRAWIGVVPFQMRNVHPRATVSLGGISAFPELNVRTYVTKDGKPGVWFLSLDAGSRVAVRAARRFFHLPYFDADMDVYMEGEWVQYRCERKGSAARLEGCYRSTTPVFLAEPGFLDSWLTERYCLYCADDHGQVYRCEIHHAPWKLQHAEAQFTVNTMVQALSLPDEAPLLHYAEQQDVLTWYLERVI